MSEGFKLVAFKNWVQAIAAVVALVATLTGFIAYFAGVIDASKALAADHSKLAARVTAVEDVLDKTNLDRFRIDRSEHDIATLTQKVDTMSQNLVDMRIMIEKLLARSEQRK